jgi:hypothetical protein
MVPVHAPLYHYMTIGKNNVFVEVRTATTHQLSTFSSRALADMTIHCVRWNSFAWLLVASTQFSTASKFCLQLF